MNKIKLASGVMLVFLVGVLAGSLGTGFYYKKRVEKFEAGGPPVQERIQIILRRFSNDLDLTKEQRIEFEKIVREGQEKQLALSSKILPEINQINDDTFTFIKERLTDDQKGKLDMLLKRMEEVRNRFPSGQQRPQRTPDQSRPQGAPDQGHSQGAPQQNPLNGTPDSIPPKGSGGPEAVPSQRGYMRLMGELKEHLNLSQEQEEKIIPIFEKLSKEQQEVFEKYRQEKQDSSALKDVLSETEKSFERDLSNILTEEQMEKYRNAKESGAVKLSLPGMP